MCSCCFFEYGINDLYFDCLTDARKVWIDDGLEFGGALTPLGRNWEVRDILTQLKNLKLVDLNNYPRGKEYNPNYTIEIDIAEIELKWFAAPPESPPVPRPGPFVPSAL